MFQDDLHSDEVKQKYHRWYGQMADAVAESLGSYLWIVKEVHNTFLASGSDIHMVPALLLMELAETIDGVSILARKGSAKPCIPLLRSGLEIQLGLRYLMEDEAKYENRCLAYEYFHFQDQLQHAQRCDPATDLGKQVRANTRGEDLADIFDQPIDDVREEIAAMQSKLDHPRYINVRTERARKKVNNWYSLWDGPRNLEGLARHLKEQCLYDILYRPWSCASHGERALSRIDGREAWKMHPIRSPKGLPTACEHACSLVNTMSVVLIDKKVPHVSGQAGLRYMERIKPGMDFLKAVEGL